MEPNTILIILGALLTLIGLLGGGFEIKELKIPRISNIPRISSLIIGLALIGSQIYFNIDAKASQSNNDNQVPPNQQYYPQDEPDPSVNTTPREYPQKKPDTVVKAKSQEDSQEESKALKKTTVQGDPQEELETRIESTLTENPPDEPETQEEGKLTEDPPDEPETPKEGKLTEDPPDEPETPKEGILTEDSPDKPELPKEDTLTDDPWDEPIPPPQEEPSLEIEAVFYMQPKEWLYIFKGNYYYRYEISNGKLIWKGNTRLPGRWENLPNYWITMDAAFFYSPENVSYFFRDNQYAKLSWNVVKDGYPVQMPGGWQSLPYSWKNGIDAGVYYPYGNCIYLFKDDQYAKLVDKRVLDGYPKYFPGGWQNLPQSWYEGIDAALYFNGHIYFFKDDEYIRFTGVKADPGYPKKIIGNFVDRID